MSGRHESTTGMGVGLAGSRRLMDHFEVETTPDKGTVVRFAKNLPPQVPPPEPGASSPAWCPA